MKTILFTLALITNTTAFAFDGNTSSGGLGARLMLEVTRSPGMVIDRSHKYIATTCRVFGDRVEKISVNLATNQQKQIVQPLNADVAKLEQLIALAAQSRTRFEVGATDVASVGYFIYTDVTEESRTPIKMEGSFEGSNSSTAAKQLVRFLDSVCE